MIRGGVEARRGLTAPDVARIEAAAQAFLEYAMTRERIEELDDTLDAIELCLAYQRGPRLVNAPPGPPHRLERLRGRLLSEREAHRAKALSARARLKRLTDEHSLDEVLRFLQDAEVVEISDLRPVAKG